MFYGKDKVHLLKNMVIIEKSVFGIGRKRKIPKQELITIEVNTKKTMGNSDLRFFSFREGKIAVQHNTRTSAFGLALDIEEAKQVIDTMNTKIAMQS